MENKNEVSTQTNINKEWEGNLSDMKKYEERTKNLIETPIFIIFAEYLGYVSRFNKLAEDWCNGKVPEAHIQKVMIIEASCIFHTMKKEFTLEEICMYYDRYFPIILQEYVEKLSKILV